MWTGCSRRVEKIGDCREKSKGRRAAEGRTDKVIDKISSVVEKERIGYRQTVEKKKEVWYNRNMKEILPDFPRLAEKIGEHRQAFDTFYRLLLQYNAAFNLTAITQEEEVFHKHFLDSLAGEGYLPQGARVAEVGSGAGFPSLPLAIVRGDLHFTLIESTGKKCAFLRTAAQELGLNVRVCEMRAEQAGREQGIREEFDAVIARAVAPLPALAEYCLPLVRVGGEMLAWKDSEDETPLARRAVQVLGGGELHALRYRLPQGYGERMLVFCKKQRPTPAKYPRGQGKERKDPIV